MNMENSNIELYDTTLRDGTQQEGISLSVQDKLLITEKLDDFGIHYIEGGWPGSNPKDAEFFSEAKNFSGGKQHTTTNKHIVLLWHMPACFHGKIVFPKNKKQT